MKILFRDLKKIAKKFAIHLANLVNFYKLFANLAKFYKLLQIFAGLVLGCIDADFCK